MEPLNNDPPASSDPTASFEMAWAKTVDEFDIDKVKPEPHSPRQEGTYITCGTPGHNHGFHIGPGKNLIQKDGKYYIEPVIVRTIGE